MLEKVWRLGCQAGFMVGQAAARIMVAQGSGTLIFTGATKEEAENKALERARELLARTRRQTV